MSSRSPTEVSFYLGLATVIATFSAAAVALGILHCTRSRDRAVAVTVLLCGTLGIGAALATVARGRTNGIANIVIAVGVVAVATCVLMRALRLIYTVRETTRPPGYPANRSSSTHRLPLTCTLRSADASMPVSRASSATAPADLGAPSAARVLRGPFWATASAFAAVVVLATLLAFSELHSSILRSRPVGSLSALVCSDGRDNDVDGKTDYPDDPDCSTPADLAEKLAACADARDNDVDGKTDYPDDPDCSSPSGGSEGR